MNQGMMMAIPWDEPNINASVILMVPEIYSPDTSDHKLSPDLTTPFSAPSCPEVMQYHCRARSHENHMWHTCRWPQIKSTLQIRAHALYTTSQPPNTTQTQCNSVQLACTPCLPNLSQYPYYILNQDNTQEKSRQSTGKYMPL